MKQEDEGDSLVGRSAALLQLSPTEFDVLPCHFNNATMRFLDEYGWENILDGYEFYPSGFKRAVPFMYASMLYHFLKGDLHKLLREKHPIFEHHSLKKEDILERITLSDIILCHELCTETRMEASGIVACIVSISVWSTYFRVMLRIHIMHRVMYMVLL